MCQRVLLFLLMATIFAIIPACSLTHNYVDPQRLAEARRFVQGIELGKNAKVVLHQTLNEMAEKNPGMAETMQRAFSDIKPSEFEEIASYVYARHMTANDLADLADFVESRTGQLFFLAIWHNNILSKNNDYKNTLIRLLNKDELEEIALFSRTEAGSAFIRDSKVINSELTKKFTDFYVQKLRDYVRRNPVTPI